MAETKLTLSLEGDRIPFADFNRAMSHFYDLVDALGEHLNREAVARWDIVGLETGSAAATIEGVSLDKSFLVDVSSSIADIGWRMQGKQAIPYPYNIAYHATQLTHIISGDITAIRLITSETEIRLDTRIPSPGRPDRTVTHGEVRGQVETLRRRQWSFTLYDELFDHAVRCYIQPDQEELMISMFGKNVVVRGEIHRDTRTDRPLEVRAIEDIQLISVPPPGSYERARGILNFRGQPPEEVLRRIRDAG